MDKKNEMHFIEYSTTTQVCLCGSMDTITTYQLVELRFDSWRRRINSAFKIKTLNLKYVIFSLQWITAAFFFTLNDGWRQEENMAVTTTTHEQRSWKTYLRCKSRTITTNKVKRREQMLQTPRQFLYHVTWCLLMRFNKMSSVMYQ